MTCEACEERLPDLVDGSLGAVIAGEVEAHLRGCAPCRDMREGLAAVAVLLRATRPLPEPGSSDLAARIANATWRGGRPRLVDRWPLAPPRGGPPWAVQVAAAVMSLVVSGAVFAWSSVLHDTGPAARAYRSANRAAADVRSTTDGWMEDIRLVRVIVSTAFEGRLDRVQEQVEDYRRLLERRRRHRAPASPSPGTPGPATS